MTGALPLDRFPVHLGLGAKALAEPEFTGLDWYDGYGRRHESDGAEGRLVALHSFNENWASWEMHPAGDEVVVCVSGRITLIQDGGDGTHRAIVLEPGEYAVNPAGTWHTADVVEPATALFITAGLGTEHRER